jgi:Holliday junction resolvase/AAA+ ATPase superfamily predicted ATPase
MFFEASKPVTGTKFFNRSKELLVLQSTISALKKGSSKYMALIGHRKTGKTSLLRQFIQKTTVPDVVFFEIDCWETKPNPKIFFQNYLLQVMDQYLYTFHAEKFPHSIRRSLTRESHLLSILSDIRSLKSTTLDEGIENLLQLRENKITDILLSEIIDFPEKLAQASDIYFVSTIDEFQELNDLNRFHKIKDTIGDIYAFFRACWQRHERMNYIISGSKISMMKELVSDERSPFFQHFKILEVKDFSESDGIHMVMSLSDNADHQISSEFAHRLIELIGTNPFYLQILASELCENEIDEISFKMVIQENLFSSVGRLYLYFQNLIGRVVGRSSSLEQTLITIARFPSTLSSLAKRMGVGTGTLKSWINRVSDFVTVENGIYQIQDRCLKLWIENKSDLKPVLPTLVLGNEAEKKVAQLMAQAGFELIYQSRASRGAFDLLAIFNSIEYGVQVKMGAFPFYLKINDLQLMQYWSEKLNWTPIFALVSEEAVYFFDCLKWKTKGRSYRIDETTQTIENLLTITDRVIGVTS